LIPRIRLTRRVATVAIAAALAVGPAAAATAATSASAGGSASTASSGTFHQVFAAYFTYSSVDRRYWAVYNNARAEKAHVAANVVTHNGYVSLQTRYDSSLGKWTTAGMCLCNDSNLKRTYGEWEMRARVSAGDSRAVALLWPTVGWPPEVDFMEMGGNGTQGSRHLNTMTVHYGSRSQNYMIHSSVSGDFTVWHTIGVRWTPTSVQYLLDGTVTRTITSGVPHQQMWFGVQTAPARGTTPTKPVTFDIDWMKEYAYSG
jgi:beta-glucanase (GH16 family)